MKAQQQADAIDTNINFCISISSGEIPVFEPTMLNVETAADNGLLAIAAEPAEKPDARLLALDGSRPVTSLSQSVSPRRAEGKIHCL